MLQLQSCFQKTPPEEITRAKNYKKDYLARKSCNVTQKQLSETTGIAQSDISKIENGSGNPTIKLLKRLADGLGMNLKIEFIPKNQLAMG